MKKLSKEEKRLRRAASTRKWRAKNLEKSRASARNWEKNNPEKFKECQHNAHKKRYNANPEKYKLLSKIRYKTHKVEIIEQQRTRHNDRIANFDLLYQAHRENQNE